MRDVRVHVWVCYRSIATAGALSNQQERREEKAKEKKKEEEEEEMRAAYIECILACS